MHHSLKLYSRHREFALRFYLFWANWTKIPVIGKIVRQAGNTWGKKLEGAYLLKTAEAEQIVDLSEELALGPCACREVSHHCDAPVKAEIMLNLHGNIFVTERPEEYRKISKTEAKDLLRDFHRRGLIHTIIKCREEYYALCSCCTCCCVPMRLAKQYGITNALIRKEDIVAEFRRRKPVPHAH